MKKIICILLPFLVFASSSMAMEFKIHYQPDMQLNIVVAEGEIIDGDAARFREVSKKADRDSEGDIVLVLNSEGGSVGAAFKMAEVISELDVFTIVPDQAICASACSSILYTSGNRRDLHEGGLLGFHTCYLSDGKTTAQSSFCNEAIAEHAMRNGLSHASVSLFVDSYGAGEMAWVGRDVACSMLLGMCRTSLKQEDIDREHERNLQMITDMVERFSKKSPSFECVLAKTIQEKLICNNSDLATLDRRMAELYQTALKYEKTKIKSDQRAWLKYSRNQCETEQCLISSYKIRIKELSLKNKNLREGN